VTRRKQPPSNWPSPPALSKPLSLRFIPPYEPLFRAFSVVSLFFILLQPPRSKPGESAVSVDSPRMLVLFLVSVLLLACNFTVAFVGSGFFLVFSTSTILISQG
jgi:hypothetical protein